MLTREQEAELIRKAQKDINAFGPLYDAYFSIVFGFIFKRVRDQALTGELTSLTFMKAINALPKYQITGAPFSSWLIQIAFNEVRQYQRRSNKNTSVPLSHADLHAVFDGLDEKHEHERNLDMLLRGLNELDEEATVYIEMRYFEGRSFKEMAEILSLSADNAKVRTYRALDRLRTIMTNFGHTK
jgi:RNA polymerase sigma-70 factor (ECF subfamily)